MPPDELVLSNLEVNLGKSDLEGGIRIAFSYPLLVEATLRSSLVDLDPILVATGGDEARAEQAGAEGGKRVFSAAPLPLDALHVHDVAMRFRGERVVAQGVTLEDVAFDLALKRGRLRLKPIRATLAAGGEIEAEFELNARDKIAKVAAAASASDVDVGALLNGLQITDLLQGEADFKTELKSRGNSVRAIMAALDGRTNLEMDKGTIDNQYVDYIAADLLDAISPWREEGEKSQVNCLVSRFDIRRGQAESKALLFDTVRITVAGGGTVDLGAETIDMQLSPRPKNASLVSLAVGINVGGTLAEPTFLPDPASVAKGVAGVAATAVVGPLGLLIPLVSAGSDDENPCVTALDQQAAAPRAAAPDEDKSVLEEAQEAVEGVTESIGKSLKGLFGGD
jgi:uncharacterized protein involved in outer membrane biogenesis